MKLLLHVNYCEGEGKLEEFFALADRLGVDGVELRMRYKFKDMTQEQYRARVEQYKQTHPEKELVFGGMVPYCRGNADEVKLEQDFCMDACNWAARFCGTKLLNFFTGAILNPVVEWRPGEMHGSAIAGEDDYQRAAAGLRTMAEHVEKLGLLLALETHPGYLHDKAESCKKILDLCGHPATGINYDQGNSAMHKFGSKVNDYFDQLGDRICYAHLKNYCNVVCPNGMGYVYCNISDGIIDTRDVIRRLRGRLRSGMLAVECPRPCDKIYAAEQDVRYVRSLMDA